MDKQLKMFPPEDPLPELQATPALRPDDVAAQPAARQAGGAAGERAGESAGRTRGGQARNSQTRKKPPRTPSSRKAGRAARPASPARPSPARRQARPAAHAEKPGAKRLLRAAGAEPEAPVAAGLQEMPHPPTAPPGAPSRGRRAEPVAETAQSLARKQREISVSEFFTKNRHLLGFDNPTKALLTAIKEAVDNSLDACEEAHILPTLLVEITRLEETRYRIAVEDNGPGIVKQEIPKIFGKLLYGSKFHRLKQSRGQQGIGISAAGMYGQLTTGQPVRIVSRTGRGKPAHFYSIAIDTQKNAPEVVEDRLAEWERDHGTRVEIDLEGVYKKGRRSVDDYVAQTALANPHAEILYRPPEGEPIHYERVSQALPRPPLEIKPHPYGVELGALLKNLRSSPARSLKSALVEDFSRVSPRLAEEICSAAGVPPATRPRQATMAQVEALFKAIPKVKILSPPTHCLSPIGEELILSAMRQQIKASFYSALTRSPAVYRGNPFQVEVGVAYGGELPAEEPVELMRFANRVPLQYQQSACAISKAAISVDWRGYGLQQPKGALPIGPMVLMVHVASVWVPFTSESKEAVAHYPDILRELRLALQDCGRKMAAHIRHHRRVADEAKKRSYIEKYIPHIGQALQEILGLSAADRDRAIVSLKDILERTRKI
jgi:DNA topoisomerase-6 subunit B